MKAKCLIICAVLFLCGNAHATSCRSKSIPVEDRVKNADVIFIGKFLRHVKHIDPKTAPFGAENASVLTVKKVFKGRPGEEEATIYYKPEHFGCSGDQFREFDFKLGLESDLLIFAKLENGKIYTSEKLGSRVADKTNKDFKYLSNLK